MKKIKFNKKTKSVLGIVLSGLLLFGAIFGIIAMSKNSEETTKEINPSYSVGGLTAEGAFQETKSSIYTKDAFDCQGLDVDLAFNKNITYQVYFYNVDSDFVSKTAVFDNNFNGEIPLFAKSCRIVITPKNDEDIKWYEINNYAKQLTIKVDKEQKEIANLFVDGRVGEQITTGLALGSSITYTTNKTITVSKMIDVSNSMKVILTFQPDVNGSVPALSHYFVGEDGKVVETFSSTNENVTDGGKIIVDVPLNATGLYVQKVSTLGVIVEVQ